MEEAREAAGAALLARTAAGLVFVLCGGLALGWLFYIGDSRTPAAEHAVINLGLAGSVMLSAVAQSLIVIGLWLLWRAARRRAG